MANFAEYKLNECRERVSNSNLIYVGTALGKICNWCRGMSSKPCYTYASLIFINKAGRMFTVDEFSASKFAVRWTEGFVRIENGQIIFNNPEDESNFGYLNRSGFKKYSNYWNFRQYTHIKLPIEDVCRWRKKAV